MAAAAALGRGGTLPAPGHGRLESHSYATIGGNCPRNCDNYDTVSNCKYNTTQHERRLNDFSRKVTAERQHEYAVPSNCLLDTTHETYNTSCERIAGETFECTSSSKYSTSSRGSSECSHSIASNHHGGPPPIPNGGPPNILSTTFMGNNSSASNNLNSNTSSSYNNSSRKPINVGGGGGVASSSSSNSKGDKSSTIGHEQKNNFNDRRLPQAMWA